MTPLPGLPDLGVLVPAAGSGERMGGVRKAFLDLAGVPLLQWAVAAFLEHPATHSVVVALPEDEAERPPAWLAQLDPRIAVVSGGATRTESVAAALQALGDEVAIVAVHDGARPFVDLAVLDVLLNCARSGVGAIPGYPAVDTLKVVDADGHVEATPDRSRHWQVQTPQVFPRELLELAYGRAVAARVRATDDAHLVEQVGGTVRVLPGNPDNLKVTWPGDLVIAQAILGARARPAQDPR